jgi:hypothetical protein
LVVKRTHWGVVAWLMVSVALRLITKVAPRAMVIRDATA